MNQICLTLCTNSKCPLRSICHRAKETRKLMIQTQKGFHFSEKKGCENLVFA